MHQTGEPLQTELMYARDCVPLGISFAVAHGLRTGLGPGRDLCWEKQLSKAFSRNTGLD